MKFGLFAAAAISIASPSMAADLSDGGLQTMVVDEPRLEKQAIREFDRRLKSIGSTAHIEQCSELRWAHPGRVQTIFGGRCKLSNKREVTLCTDTAVGAFELAYDAGAISDFMDRCE